MYGFTKHMGPDEHYIDILRTIYAIRGNQDKLSVITPLLYESRQHRRKGRESLDCAESLQTLIDLKVDNIVTFDAHDENIINAIPNSCFENFLPTDYLLSEFLDKEEINITNAMVIAPDSGADERALRFAELLKCDYGMFRKRRDLRVVVNGKNPIISHDYIGSSVEGKDVIIVDDMIASGGSCLEVAEELKGKGANKVFIFATFAQIGRAHV